jgi:oxygen-dependent protoporphyrinogen oxidase
MQRFDCVVVGGGLAGLLAAYEASNAGKSVVLYEATKHYGGAIASIDIMGIKVDAGAESFATTRPEALSLIKELGLSDLLVTPERSDARIFNQGQSFLIPHGMMGIPSDLTDPNTIALLGDEEAAYAAELDSLPWNITDERTLGAVVAKRLGPLVVEKIVNPVVAGVHASDSYLLEMESVLGSLHKAVKNLRGSASIPGSAVAGINGGVNLITWKLFLLLKERGVKIIQNSPVSNVFFDGSWKVVVNDQLISSDYLVIATNPISGASILSGFKDLAESLSEIHSVDVALVLLAIRAPELAAAPLGSGALIADQGFNITAKASTHVTAKWAWVKDLTEGIDLIRLSYGRNGVVDPSDTNLLESAGRDVAILYGLDHPEILQASVIRWPNSLIQARIGHQDILQKIEQTLLQYPGLMIVGSGVSGNGIAGVIGRTRKKMEVLLNV